VIVADEPTSALDVVIQRQIMGTLGQLQAGLGAAVILVGHDMGLVAQFAERIGVMYAGKLVEVGTARQIFKEPLHPYTQMLIKSLPSLDHRHELTGIPGLPPTLLNLPPGCPFSPRCPAAMDRCRIEMPMHLEARPGRWTSCHLYTVKAS
jgi:peptide/nickel transport system ATP-binding protein